MNLTGTVHSLPNAKGDLFVQMGILRSQVNIKDLVLIEDAAPGSKKYAKTGAGKLKMSKSASVSTEINLIGKQWMKLLLFWINTWMMLILHIFLPCASYTERNRCPAQCRTESFETTVLYQVLPLRRIW